MAWELSSWMVLTRTFQLFASLVIGCMNGFLISWIYLKKLGLSQNMILLEMMICVLLIYTALVLLIQHTGGRSKRSGWLVAFIVFDVIYSGMDIGLITVLARAGLPSNCVGLTRSDYSGDDSQNRPGEGYTTVRFSDESGGQKGELDKYCAFERTSYFVAIFLLLLVMVTVVLSVLRICEGNYTKNTRVSDLLASLERASEKEQQSPLLMTAPRFISAPPPPPSEGIITRQGSLRSIITSATAPMPNRTSTDTAPIIPRRPVPNRASNLSITSQQRISLHDGHGEYDVAGDAALVSDGMHPRRYSNGPEELQHPPRQQPLMPMLIEEDDNSSLADAALVADGMRHHPMNLSPIHEQRPPISLSDPGLDSESDALVSDGMRSMPHLPPYTPGSSRMSGHADEGNEIRLSEYVKGRTRAQDMKDSGGFN